MSIPRRCYHLCYQLSIIIIKFKCNNLRATGDTRLVNMVKKLPLLGIVSVKERNSSYLYRKGLSEGEAY